jgi:hypothetical protein
MTLNIANYRVPCWQFLSVFLLSNMPKRSLRVRYGLCSTTEFYDLRDMVYEPKPFFSLSPLRQCLHACRFLPAAAALIASFLHSLLFIFSRLQFAFYMVILPIPSLLLFPHRHSISSRSPRFLSISPSNPTDVLSLCLTSHAVSLSLSLSLSFSLFPFPPLPFPSLPFPSSSQLA